MSNHAKLLDCLKKTDKSLKTTFFVTELVMTPIIMSRIFDIIKFSERNLLANILLIVRGLVIKSIPGLLVDLTIREIDKIKQIIGNQLLMCQDDNARELLKDSHLFFEHHPFRYTVWRLFSVNNSRNIAAMNTIITYTLAMVQFAHVYG
uniref:Gustatory receptor n=1 Tax=Heliothis virescens TaxID=7102 RepID=A0A2A4JQF4_HELVI